MNYIFAIFVHIAPTLMCWAGNYNIITLKRFCLTIAFLSVEYYIFGIESLMVNSLIICCLMVYLLSGARTGVMIGNRNTIPERNDNDGLSLSG